MRTKKVLKNIMVAWGGQFIVIMSSILARYFFVTILNMEYLGVSGLFTNIVTLLSLTELGIGAAIIYELYEPLAQGNEKLISAYMKFYKMTYLYIGIAVAVIGVMFMPFIHLLIEDNIEIEHIKVIYFLFVLSSSSSYLFSYKQSLVIADQKKYVIDVYHSFFKILQIILSTTFLYITRQYVVYLVSQIIIVFIENIILSKKIDKMYPLLMNLNNNLEGERKKTIWKNTSALFIHKVGTVIVNSTDSLIIAKYIDIFSVGIYSNYYLISSAVQNFITMIFVAATASVGNFNAIENKEKKNELFNVMAFAEFWVCGFSVICLYCLWNPFITLWLGSDYLLPDWVVAVLALKFYILGKRQVVLLFRDALGLFWYDRYKAVIEAVFNIGLSIFLVKRIGIAGVFLGTIISNMLVCQWLEPYILSKYALNFRMSKYFMSYWFYLILTVLAAGVTKFVCIQVDMLTQSNFIIKSILCVTLPNLIFLLFCIKNKNMVVLVQRIKDYVKLNKN